MATAKSARCRFRVKESAPEAREIREGVIDFVADPFLTAECADDTPVSERPVEDPDFLAFGLPQGTSLEEAEQIARFLDDHIASVSIVRFGDVEDLSRDVDLSERARQIDFERLSNAVIELKQSLATQDRNDALDSLKAIESICANLIRGWADALKLAQGVLAKFGEGQEPNA